MDRLGDWRVAGWASKGSLETRATIPQEIGFTEIRDGLRAGMACPVWKTTLRSEPLRKRSRTWRDTAREEVRMKNRQVGTKDTTQLLISGGCFLSIPIIIAGGFKLLLGYAKNKEHQFAHQVEEVELEGEAAAKLSEGLTPKEAAERFLKKLERITEQFERTGARFDPADFANEQKRLELLSDRAKESGDRECSLLLDKAKRLLLRFAPN